MTDLELILLSLLIFSVGGYLLLFIVWYYINSELEKIKVIVRK
jgi:hypothetical protein